MLYIIFVSLLVLLLVYFLFFMMFYKSIMDFESMSTYECGFDPNCHTRLVFSYRFFLISILFIIFDVEISLMLPIPFLIMSIYMLIIFFFFIFVLIIGLLYEYYYGSLDWLDIFMSKA